MPTVRGAHATPHSCVRGLEARAAVIIVLETGPRFVGVDRAKVESISHGDLTHINDTIDEEDEKVNHRSLDEEPAEGSSSNTNYDQDSDISFRRN